MPLLIKICGLRTQADADAAAGVDAGAEGLGAGADFCGFIFHPASPRGIAPEAAGAIETRAMKRVGVVVDLDENAAAAAALAARLDFLQLHGAQSQAYARRVRALATARTGRPVGVIRVLWPERYPGPAALAADLRLHAPDTDLFLLDAGASGGGSGRRLDPERLAGLNKGACPRPWLLAGGLTPDNVVETLAWPGPRPAGVDLNSGLEDRPGHKDARAIRAALRALRSCGQKGTPLRACGEAE